MTTHEPKNTEHNPWYGWNYEYLCFSFMTKQAVVRINSTALDTRQHIHKDLSVPN